VTGVRLARHLSLVTAWGLPPWSTGPTGDDDVFAIAAEAGYEGVQVLFPDQATKAVDAGLAVSALGRADTADDVDNLLSAWTGSAVRSVTLHLGTGFEPGPAGEELVAHTLDAGRQRGLAVLVETHRATLFQDPARALGLAATFPELRFTADLSHWYTGVEMVYGDLEAKLEAIEPILRRCRMIHGRISDPGCIQVGIAVDDPAPYVEHFRRMWTTVAEGAVAGVADEATDELPFVVELLPASAHYARTIPDGDGGRREETDRWSQADVLWEIAQACFAAATARSPSRN
jgi:hypothetical protein